MSIRGNPITLTVNQTVSVPQTVSGATDLAGVVLLNLSPYLCAVQVGVLQDWIPPYSAWPSPQTQLGLITVTPQLLGSAPAGAPSSLVPTYFLAGETMPDPQTLMAAAISAAIAGTVTTQSPMTQIGEWRTAGGLSNSPAMNVPAGTQSIIVCATGAGEESQGTQVVKFILEALVLNSDPWFGVGANVAAIYDGLFPSGLNYIVQPWETFATQLQLKAATLGMGTTVNFWAFASPLTLPAVPEPSFLPSPDNILGNHAIVGASPQALITIPQGRVWRGTVYVAASSGGGLGSAYVQSDGNCKPASKRLVSVNVQPNANAMPTLAVGPIYVAASQNNGGNLSLGCDNTIQAQGGAFGILL